MISAVVNAAAIVVGSVLGLFFKKGIPEKVRGAVMTGIALCVLYIGVDGALKGENVIVAIITMVLGAIAGTLLDIDGAVNRLGDWIGGRFKKREDGTATVAEGFVTGSLLFGVGAMAITGSLAAGLTGDNSIIFTKSVLDFISSIMLTASLGIGVAFSAAVILVFQGGIALLAQFLEPVLNANGAIAEITCVGSLLILALGLNMLGLTKIKVANFLPAIVFAPAVCWIAARLSGIIA